MIAKRSNLSDHSLEDTYSKQRHTLIVVSTKSAKEIRTLLPSYQAKITRGNLANSLVIRITSTISLFTCQLSITLNPKFEQQAHILKIKVSKGFIFVHRQAFTQQKTLQKCDTFLKASRDQNTTIITQAITYLFTKREFGVIKYAFILGIQTFNFVDSHSLASIKHSPCLQLPQQAKSFLKCL